jgi:hypothetical protein
MSKMRGSISGGMPMPLSVTRTVAAPSCAAATTRICPPLGVYFAALCSRFENTCTSRVVSP